MQHEKSYRAVSKLNLGLNRLPLLLGPSREKFLEDVEAVLADVQPSLLVVDRGRPILVKGTFSLQSSEGSIDTYQIQIAVNEDFPDIEPVVFEIGNRIPRITDRHTNPDGSCCITVWESWLATARDLTFRGYLKGPVQEFFLNQFFYEKTGKWRLGERPHFVQGAVEAFAEVLGTPATKDVVIRYLQSVAEKPKGHLLCPCGSGKILRHCHKAQLHKLYAELTPKLAKRMLKRLA